MNNHFSKISFVIWSINRFIGKIGFCLWEFTPGQIFEYAQTLISVGATLAKVIFTFKSQLSVILIIALSQSTGIPYENLANAAVFKSVTPLAVVISKSSPFLLISHTNYEIGKNITVFLDSYVPSASILNCITEYWFLHIKDAELFMINPVCTEVCLQTVEFFLDSAFYYYTEYQNRKWYAEMCKGMVYFKCFASYEDFKKLFFS